MNSDSEFECANKTAIDMAAKDIIFCSENDTIDSVVGKIVKSGHRRIPVVSKGSVVVGVVTKSDILDAFLRGEPFENTISEIMTRNPIVCESSEPMEHVIQKFRISRRGGFPVVERGKLVGMISERDIAKRKPDSECTVGKIMTRKPMVVQSNVSVHDCLKTMVNTKYRRLPVVEGRKLVGIVTSEDLLAYIYDKKYSIEELDEPIDVVMKNNVITVSPDESVYSASETMDKNGIGGLIVVSEGNLLEGIVTEHDIVKKT